MDYKNFYKNFSKTVSKIRQTLGRDLTYAEKVLFTHLQSNIDKETKRGEETLDFLPDRVAMQDATAQMAVLQFMVAEIDSVKIPTSIHCDHLIRAHQGSKKDLLSAIDENKEVYDFLKSASKKYGMGFWEPGAGIIHQVVLEQYAFPAGMMIGTDSHTPNAGGMGMIAVGVGGADAVDAMVGEPWELLNPKLIGVKLTGKLSGWASAKDVILSVAGKLTVKGGTGKIVEYFGEGANSLSLTGKSTICNMGAELGATTSIFPVDSNTIDYLNETERKDIADALKKYIEELKADKSVENNPSQFFDEVIEINLSELEPQLVGPHTPDLLTKISDMKEVAKKENYPTDIRVALIGSCTNSSYEDISRSASIAKQAVEKGYKAKIPFLVTPGSDQIYQTIKRDGFLDTFEKAGATVLANACGPCIGQWKRDDIKKGERNTIVTSYNRNFRKRNDGNTETLSFIGSPELVTAMAFSGDLTFNPQADEVQFGDDSFKFKEPVGDSLPKSGFIFSKDGFAEPIKDESIRKDIKVTVDPNSERIALLEPFKAWDGKDYTDLKVLVKTKGKCTTDHISQAGPWLKYRGHLKNISGNLFLGAINSFTDKAGEGLNIRTNLYDSFPNIAEDYRLNNISWVAVSGENYGEGSSREHAAMEPRFTGCKAVIAKSFARIAETNLKKQGVLALTFDDPNAYDLIKEKDSLSVIGLEELAPESKLSLKIESTDGSIKETSLSHTLNERQIAWFKAGSALNHIKSS